MTKKCPFSRPKFLMTFLFFSHRPGFFAQIFRIFTVLNVVCDLFFTRKATISEKNSLMTPFYFTLFVLSRAFDNTTSQNIGGTDSWAVPTSNFLGGPPPSPPRSPPLQGAVYYNVLNTGLVLANHGSIYMNNARF